MKIREEKQIAKAISVFQFMKMVPDEGNCAIDTVDRLKSFCVAFRGKRIKYCDLVK